MRRPKAIVFDTFGPVANFLRDRFDLWIQDWYENVYYKTPTSTVKKTLLWFEISPPWITRGEMTGPRTFDYAPPALDVVLKALGDDFQKGTDFVLLFEWERVYECRRDCQPVPLAAA